MVLRGMSSGRMDGKTGVSEHSIYDLHCTENAEKIQMSPPSGACDKLLCSGLFPPPRMCRPQFWPVPVPLAISALPGLLGSWSLPGEGLCSREQPRPWPRSPQSPGPSLPHADGRSRATHQGPSMPLVCRFWHGGIFHGAGLCPGAVSLISTARVISVRLHLPKYTAMDTWLHSHGHLCEFGGKGRVYRQK